MPLYEYHCAKCGRFEALQRFSEGPLDACPTCGAVVERLISAPAFQFKGKGWYVTDYGKSGSEEAASKESGSKGTETRPETAPGTSKEAATPTSADSKSSTTSLPKEGTGPAAKAMAPAANPSQ
jgi:putative FmdB family regulatory protein